MSVETQLMTFAEFEKISDPPSGHYELHHGQLILMPPRKKPHVKAQQVLYKLLVPFLDDEGFLATELPFRPSQEYEAWQCDIGFVREARWIDDHNDYFLGAPDLVVEVLSQSNTMDEILDRQDICLANGCSAFWTLDPKRQTVMVTTPDRKTVTFDRLSSVPLPKPFQGTIEVAKIFK